jgi:F-type H+-transporting ATPase subunit gamma
MMRRAELAVRLRSLSELDEVVVALRSVSVARVRQARERLDCIRGYTAVVQRGLADALRAGELAEGVPPSRGRAVVVAFGSDRGFVGAYNERIVSRTLKERSVGAGLLVVGSRAAAVMRGQGVRVDWMCPATANLAAIDDVALRIAEELGREVPPGPVNSALLVYAREPLGEVVETLLPLDLQPSSEIRPQDLPPLMNLRPSALVASLAREMLFAQLERALTESFASENMARLATMEAASDNVARRLDGLRRLDKEARQEEITTELLDVIVGAEAVARDLQASGSASAARHEPALAVRGLPRTEPWPSERSSPEKGSPRS